MNDRYDPYESYDPYASQEPQIVGYDAYGQPVYQQHPAPQPEQPSYGGQVHPQEPYAGPGYGQQAGYPQDRYDPYAPPPQEQQPYDPYAGYGQQPAARPQQDHAYDPQAQAQAQAGQQAGYAPAPGAAQRTAPEAAPAAPLPPAVPESAGTPEAPAEPAGPPGGTGAGQDREYRTEQFSFIEEPDEDSEDVIDWLKFTESRTERREEARRRGRNRVVALVAVLALALAGGAGYLWATGGFPGSSDTAADKGGPASGPQRRDVVVVQLLGTAKDSVPSTAMLVDNTTTKQGATVLLPGSLVLAGDGGQPVTLVEAVDEAGPSGVQESLTTLLGARIDGTWRLDTPYLENLVEQVGTIDLDTDVDVPDPDARKKGEAPLVRKGGGQTLSGAMAVAYATYRAPGEPQTAQLNRFGQVMQAVLRKFPTDSEGALLQVQTLAQVLDPSFPEKDLAAALAKLAERAKSGDYRTTVLPVRADGTLSEKTADGVVKDILGGSVTAPAEGAPVRVGLKNATGSESDGEKARAALVNGGFDFVGAGRAPAALAASQVVYADASRKADAVEIAKTLGLPASAATEGKVAPNADVSVLLGQDYGG